MHRICDPVQLLAAIVRLLVQLSPYLKLLNMPDCTLFVIINTAFTKDVITDSCR